MATVKAVGSSVPNQDGLLVTRQGHQTAKTLRDITTLYYKDTKISEASRVQSSWFCTFAQKRIEKIILCTTLSPKFLMTALRHCVPHTAAGTEWDCCKQEENEM